MESRAKNTQDRRYQRTDKAIREALLECMEEQNYRKVTVTALAARADIDRKTFYLHYQSIEQVVDAIVRDEAALIAQAIRQGMASGGAAFSVRGLFLHLSTNLAPDLARTRRIAKHVSTEALLEKLEQPLAKALLEDNAMGLSNAQDQSARFCITFFVAGLVSAYRDWLLLDSELPLEQLADVLDAVVSHGLAGLAQLSESVDI